MMNLKRDKVFEIGNKVDELLTRDYKASATGLIFNETDRVIEMHMFKGYKEYKMQYVFNENLSAKNYYDKFMLDYKNRKLKEFELNSEERYFVDVLIDNKVELDLFTEHVFSFKNIYNEDAIDLDDITKLEYNKETNIMKVHMNLDDVDVIIDFNKSELRYIVENKEVDFEDYLDYLDMKYDREKRIKETKKYIEENKVDEDDVEEYETTDLAEFVKWMDEFNEQEQNYEYDLIIKNKNITQISEDEEYQFCAIEDITKYYKTVKADGTILLAIAFKYAYDAYDEHEEIWNISPDAGFEM